MSTGTRMFNVYECDGGIQGPFVGYAWAYDEADAIRRVTGYTGDGADLYCAVLA